MSGFPYEFPAEFPGGDDTPAEVTPDGGSLVAISDVCADGLALLIRQYRDSPRLQSLICAVLDRVQSIENALIGAYTGILDIDGASGANLRILGRIVREDQNGRSDSDYRDAIRTRIAANRSQGRREDLIRVAVLFTKVSLEAGAYVKVQDVIPGTTEVRIDRTAINDAHEANRFQQRAKAAGVHLTTITAPPAYPRTRLFRLSRAADYPESNTTTGLSRVSDRSTGGGLAFALS